MLKSIFSCSRNQQQPQTEEQIEFQEDGEFSLNFFTCICIKPLSQPKEFAL